MSSLTEFDYENTKLKRSGSDFSITERLHEYIRNYDWQAGFNDVINNNLPRDANGKIDLNACPENASLWIMLSATFEPIASEIYEKIDSIVKRTVDIDVCDIDSLYSISDMMGVQGVENVTVDYPLEIKSLIEIFSTNKSKALFIDEMLLEENIDTISAYIIQSGVDKMSGFDLSAKTFVNETSTYVNDWTDEQIASIQAISSNFIYDNYDSYIEYMENQFYTTLMNFINDDDFLQQYYDKIYVSKEYTVDTILDTREDEEEIRLVKVEYNVPENFSAKLEADNIIANRKNTFDFTDEELAVIEAEIERRAEFEKYGNAPKNEEYRRFRYEQERKFREYIYFIENLNILNRSITVDQDYSPEFIELNIDDYKFFDYYNDIAPPLTGGTPVSADMIESAVHYLRNLTLDAFYKRERIRANTQKFKHIGTSELIEVIISDYIYKNFAEKSKWNYYEFPELSAFSPSFSGIALGGDALGEAVYNTVRVIEYVDETEYFNIENPATVGQAVNPRYWENETISTSSDATSTDYYNFYKNLGLRGTFDEMQTFIDKISEIGAVSATLDTLTADIVTNPALTGLIESNLSGMHLKYFGNTSGDFPWVNDKNQIHPSIALHPYIWSLQEYGSLVFSLPSIYNNTVQTSSELIDYLARRIDENGSLQNLWQSDAVTMGSYEDAYQFSPNFDNVYAENEKIDYDGPFIFEALDDYLQRNADGGLTATDISEFYTEWYSHLSITDDEIENKIKWQLENHLTDILSLANKKIFQFAVDKYGTQYTLFKDTVNYFEAGEIWVKYKNHPISFPLSKPLTSQFEQIDITSFYDDNDEFFTASKQAYDFKLLTVQNKIILVAHTAGGDSANPIPSRSGVVYYLNILRNEDSENEFYADRLVGNNWYYDLNAVSGEYVGVYKSDSFDGEVFGLVSRIGYTSAENIGDYYNAVDDVYSWTYRFRYYDELHGITTQNRNIFTKFPLYDTNDPTDLHNRFKLNRQVDTLSIIYESSNVTVDNAPYLFNGTGNNGKYNTEYNTAKQGYHNGFTIIDFSMTEDEPYPNSYKIKYFEGYNDVGYHSVEAWEGYIGSTNPLDAGEPVGQLSTELQQYSTNDDGFIGMEFMGMSDPSTSARFDIDNMQFLCYNSNDEYLGLYVGNIYPTWADATFSWDSVLSGIGLDTSKWVPLSSSTAIPGDYRAWNSSDTVFRLFTEEDQTLTFATLGSDNLYYDVTVTYKGRGCQKFQIDIGQNTKLNDNVKIDYAALDSRYFVYSTNYANITNIDGATSGTVTVELLDENKYDILKSNDITAYELRKDHEFPITEFTSVSAYVDPNEIVINVSDVSIYTLNEKISLREAPISFLGLESEDGVLLLEDGDKLILETYYGG